MNDQNVLQFELVVAHDNFIVRDHQVHRVRIMPGVTLLDMTYRLGNKALGHSEFVLNRVLFKQPIATHESFDQKLRLTFTRQTEQVWQVQVQSQKIIAYEPLEQAWVDVMECSLSLSENQPVSQPLFDIPGFIASAAQQRDVDQSYATARATDIEHGPFMKTLGTVYQRNNERLAILHLGELAEKFRHKFYAHPAFLDGATLVGLLQHGHSENGTVPYIPFSIRQFALYHPFPQTIYVFTSSPGSTVDPARLPDLVACDLTIYDETGRIIAEFTDLTAKRIREARLINQLVGQTLPVEEGAKANPIESMLAVDRASIVGANEEVLPNLSLPTNGFGQNYLDKNSGSDGPTKDGRRNDGHRGTDTDEAITSYLQRQIAGILDTPDADISPDIPFYEIGLESINLLELTKDLETRYGLTLYPTLLFEYTTIAELAGYLSQAGAADEQSPNPLPDQPLPTGKDHPVANHLLAEPAVEEVKQSFEASFYQPQWREQPLPANLESGPGTKHTLLYCPNRNAIETLYRGRFENRSFPMHLQEMKNSGFQTELNIKAQLWHQMDVGASWLFVAPGQQAQQIDDNYYILEQENVNAWPNLIAALKKKNQIPSTVVFLSHLENSALDLAEGQVEGIESYLRHHLHVLVQIASSLIKAKIPQDVTLLYLYRTQDSLQACLDQAMLGFGKTLEQENPKFRFKAVELESDSTRKLLPLIRDESVGQVKGGSHIRYHLGRRQVQSFEPCVLKEDTNAKTAAPQLRNEGTYIITGGAGGIGLIVAEGLLRNYAANLVLVGRSPLNETNAQQIDYLKSLAFGSVCYQQADVTSLEDVSAVVTQTRNQFGKIHGMIHAAGVIQDALIPQKTFAQLGAVIEPKVQGTLYLDRLLAEDELDLFVLFSSTTAVFGNVGQADYGYANRFLDTFAAYRQRQVAQGARYGHTISINWPLWEHGGMRTTSAALNTLTKAGQTPLDDRTGWRLFEMAVNQEQFHQLVCLWQKRPEVTPTKARENGFQPATIPNATQEGIYDPHKGEFPTSSQTIPTTGRLSNDNSEDIAVIGLSGRYPMAETLEQFWENIKAGRHCIREIPPERWDYRLYDEPDSNFQDRENFGHIYSHWGGFIDDIDKFDPFFFNISPREAELMDPQERLFLETVWATVEDAGYSRATLAKVQEVGVFVGVMNAGYSQVRHGGATPAPTSYWSIANRVSYLFDWHGPSLAVDTACSSSLTAIHLACESIKRGECALAVAGGVNLIIHPSQYMRMSAMNMLAQDDKVKAFGAGADGFVDGEGVGAVLLKPLAQAQADGDPIYGVIKGSAMNASGRTSGYTVPNPQAQRSLIAKVLSQSGIEADTISYIEAHGTGTALGDPIEIKGLTQAFGSGNSADHSCSLGSVKSNIGHLESAAGIAGLTKVLLQMRHQQLVPSLHSETLNPHIDFEATPFVVQRQLTTWDRLIMCVDGEQRTVPRRAGLSSFGAGGSNVHLIVEEYGEEGLGSRDKEIGDWGQGVGNKQYLIVLSAKNEDRLQAYVNKLLFFLEESSKHSKTLPHATLALSEAIGCHLPDIAYTLQVGREPMSERLAVVVSSLEELRERLQRYQGQTKVEGLYRGNVKGNGLNPALLVGGEAGQAFIQTAIQNQELDRLAQLWVAGLDIEWTELYPGGLPNRISLPTYPFARRRCWIDRGEPSTGDRESNLPRTPVVQPEKIGANIPTNSLEMEIGPSVQLYQPTWHPRPLPSSAGQSETLTGPIFLFGHDNQEVAALNRLLMDEGGNTLERIIFVVQGEEFAIGLQHNSVQIDPDKAADYAALFNAFAPYPQGLSIIHRWGCRDEAVSPESLTEWLLSRSAPHQVQADMRDGLDSLFYLNQSLDEISLKGRTRLLVMADTYGEQALPHHTAMAGYLQSWRIQDPALMSRLVEVEQTGQRGSGAMAIAWQELCNLSDSEGGEVRYQDDGQRLALGFESVQLPDDRSSADFNGTTQETPKEISEQSCFKQYGVYLITGGAGGIGRTVAQYLLKSYDATVILTGRSALDPQREVLLQALAPQNSGAQDGRVHYIQADVTDRSQMRRVIAEIKTSFGPLTGLIHAAGSVEGGLLEKRDKASLDRVLAPKMSGVLTLDEVTKDEELECFILFSSTSAVLGLGGCADYASGNRFLDEYAHLRNRLRTQGLRSGRTLSINWTLWQESGIAAGSQPSQGLTDEEGLAALEYCCQSALAQVIVAKKDDSFVQFITPSRDVRDDGQTENSPSPVANYYDAYDEQENLALPQEFFLNYAPFPEPLAGFSWVKLFGGERNAAYEQIIREKHREMRNVMFRDVDFARTKRALDIGCGYGSDLIWFAKQHPHLRLDGYTISPKQADICLEKIEQENVQPQVQVYCRDSSQNAFPSHYDLIFGLEVMVHIQDKSALFRNIAQHLNEEGTLIIADFVSNLRTEIEDSEIGTYTPTKEQWAALFSEHHLELRKSIDVSQEIANFLYDANFEQNQRVKAEYYENSLTRRYHEMYNNLHTSLGEGLVSYVLMTARKVEPRATAKLEAINHQRLMAPLPYRHVIQNNPALVVDSQGIFEDAGRLKHQQDDLSAEQEAQHLPNENSVRTFDDHELGKIVQDEVRNVLKYEASEIDGQMSFEELGVDSISAVKIIEALNTRLDLYLKPTVLFSYPALDVLTNHIIEHYGEALKHRYTSLPESSESRRENRAYLPSTNKGSLDQTQLDRIQSGESQLRESQLSESQLQPTENGLQRTDSTQRDSVAQKSRAIPLRDIAIIGMSGRFPKAQNLDEFWNNLREGIDCVEEVPAHRWVLDDYYDPDPAAPNKSYSKWAGLLDGIDQFDPLFFNISPKEAVLMDPQQRLFLQEAWHAVEDAGYTKQDLSGSPCGVFVGVETGDYAYLAQDLPADSFSATAYAPAILAARISYFLDLKGPNLVIDTSCSSSLVAVHQACQSILSGESEMALAGGVHLLATPRAQVLCSKNGMLAPDGRCKPFDDQANGIALGEGVGVVILKPLANAINDGDHIYGVIKGSGINQDGLTKGITAPSALSQRELETQVYAKAGINPDTITLVEAHGTGTKLGDPIEIHALTEAFQAHTSRKGYCALGSVKSNIGHTSTAAGVAGLIKVLLALKHQQIPPALHYETPNSHVSLAETPFTINTTLKAWATKDNLPRRAAVSSFGFSGTNAHLVLEEYPSANPATDINPGDGEAPQVIVLSARDEERLREYAHKLLVYLIQTSTPQSTSLGLNKPADIHTLQQFLFKMVADLLGIDVAEIETDQTLVECGLDVVALSHLQNTLEERYSCELPVTQTIAEMSIDEVAQYLAPEISTRPATSHQLPATSHQYPLLANIAFTLQVGREAMEERLAVAVSTIEELIEQLQQYLNQDNPTDRIYRGNIKENQQNSAPLIEGAAGDAFIKAVVDNQDYDKIAQLWVSGVTIDWRRLHEQGKPQRISLPTYPFAREQYWVSTSNGLQNGSTSPNVTAQTIVAQNEADLLYGRQEWQHRPLDDGNNARHEKPPATTLLLLGLEVDQVESLRADFGQGQVVALSTPEADAAESVTHLLQSGWKHLKAIVAKTPKKAHQIVIVIAESVESYQYAALAGMLKTAQIEHPHIRCKVLMVAEADRKMLRSYLRQEALADSFQSVEVRYREPGDREVRTLTKINLTRHAERNYPQAGYLKAGGVYWITGGLGGLGRIFAHHLLNSVQTKHEAPITLVLSGRSSLGEAEQTQLAELNNSDGTVVYLEADVSKRADVEQAVAHIKDKYGHLDGIIHSAGVLRDSLLVNKTAAEFEAVLAPKVSGALNIDAVTQDVSLDFMIFFSSVAGVLGNFGQADYAAANAFLDSFADRRNALVQERKRSGRTLAINWPLWEAGGMSVDAATLALMARQTGMAPLTATSGLQAFEAIMTSDEQQILVAYGRTSKLATMLFAEPSLWKASDATHSTTAPQPTVHRNGNTKWPAESLAQTVQAELATAVSELLQVQVQDIRGDESLSAYGFDSITLTQMTNKLNATYDLSLMPTIFFENDTLASLSHHLAAHYREQLSAYYLALADENTPPPTPTVRKGLRPSVAENVDRYHDRQPKEQNQKQNEDQPEPGTIYVEYTKKRAPAYSVVVPIRTTGAHPPLFCVHPLVGMIYPYYDLAAAMSLEQPVYGLQAVGLDREPHTSIEEMASCYLNELRQIQPTGPYFLSGWSLGGLIAYEMAQQLQRGSESVALLALFDMAAPIDEQDRGRTTSAKLLRNKATRNVRPYVRDYLRLRASSQEITSPSVMSANSQSKGAQPSHIATGWQMSKLVAKELYSLTSAQSPVRRISKLVNTGLQAISNYEPEPYPGLVTLFRAEQQARLNDSGQALGWEYFAQQGVEVHQVPGSHLTIMQKPNVAILAQKLQRCLENNTHLGSA
ncbi:MAG: SDR family NAD(P)-dependent oxidoreductase [Chloroflexota bacterium]